MSEKESGPCLDARNILRGVEVPPPEKVLELVKSLKAEKKFHYARELIGRSRDRLSAECSSATRLKLAQEHSLCTYKDVDLPADERFPRALEILAKDCDLASTTNPETLGLAGAIHKYYWQWDGRNDRLEQALNYYLKGYESAKPGDPHYDYGYTGINAAYVLDVLASCDKTERRDSEELPSTARLRREKATTIRHQLVEDLPNLVAQPGNHWLKTKWWFLVTIAEAHFGLGNYENAIQLLQEARAVSGDVADWEKESTVRQFCALAQLQELAPASRNQDPTVAPWEVLQRGLAISELSAKAALMGKVGLALSGGGFRAALFHIGVLAQLADLDILRQVEVLSCVSGGSIIGAHYYLEVRKLLRDTPDREITREDYIRIVRRVAEDFLCGVQENLRTRVAEDLTTNLRIAFSSNYSHTERLGELYEQHLFSRVTDGENGTNRWLDKLHIRPAGEPPGFQPKLHNWPRQAKAPILILNATTLNSCHNWQFTVSWMGESPALIDPEIDGNDRLRRMYYGEAPTGFKNFRLGRAVAASSCVPGLFTPIALPNLYPDRLIQLVDGGVNDNQGIAGLLEQECTVVIVSDASGQTAADADPSTQPLGVLTRANDILMSRVRQLECEALKTRRRSGLLRHLALMHLKMDLNVDPVDWKNCPDPHETSENARPIERRGRLTRYGIAKTVQEKLAALRTDLDSFSDIEAFALMTSAYRMTGFELSRHPVRFPPPSAGPTPWHFLTAVAAWMEQPVPTEDETLKMLDFGRLQLFKAWFQSVRLKNLAIITSLLMLGFLGWATYAWRSTPILTVGGFAMSILIALAGLVLGSTIERMLTYPRKLTVGVLASVFLWFAARLHLRWIDPKFLRRGKRHLNHDQTLAWVQANVLWRKAKKTGRIYVRELSAEEKGRETLTFDGVWQRPAEGDVLCVGLAGEPWFQPRQRVEARYVEGDTVEMHFPAVESCSHSYRIFRPRADALCWAAQVNPPEIKSFSLRLRRSPTDPLTSSVGGYVVTECAADSDARPDLIGETDVWLVQQKVFEMSYEFVTDE
ncbi:MAG: patatin-like phospholipase family protein [Gemmataceae bacterium]